MYSILCIHNKVPNLKKVFTLCYINYCKVTITRAPYERLIAAGRTPLANGL